MIKFNGGKNPIQIKFNSRNCQEVYYNGDLVWPNTTGDIYYKYVFLEHITDNGINENAYELHLSGDIIEGYKTSPDVCSEPRWQTPQSDVVDPSGKPYVTPMAFVRRVVFDNGVVPKYLSYWFSHLYGGLNDPEIMLEEYPFEWVNFNYLNVSRVTSMKSVFEECHAPELDLSSWGTYKVTDMTHMFYWCSAKHIYVTESWTVENVIKDTEMFYNCDYLPNFESASIGKDMAEIGKYLEIVDKDKSWLVMSDAPVISVTGTNLLITWTHCAKDIYNIVKYGADVYIDGVYSYTILSNNDNSLSSIKKLVTSNSKVQVRGFYCYDINTIGNKKISNEVEVHDEVVINLPSSMTKNEAKELFNGYFDDVTYIAVESDQSENYVNALYVNDEKIELGTTLTIHTLQVNEAKVYYNIPIEYSISLEEKDTEIVANVTSDTTIAYAGSYTWYINDVKQSDTTSSINKPIVPGIYRIVCDIDRNKTAYIKVVVNL